ncbi:zinc ribbon domain-containing protein [Microtetraspora niveoalba]|uniref:zinc ribbon domain-containing protein n=1 Tax=Microtetraspora niveoalba TaxID=46175 RepID=UPI00082A2758|nr:zinc ribbon domain-containing protein [Microtetraspora niveoalba]
MKLVVQVKLLPDAATQAALRETLVLCNRAANHASRRAFTTGVKGKTSLQRVVYGEPKAMGLSAQPAIHAIRKVADAYATLKANLKAGNYGPQGSRRRAAVESTPVRLRKDAAQPFDDRCLSWQLDARTVSIWTARGRCGRIPFACSPAQLDMLTRYRRFAQLGSFITYKAQRCGVPVVHVDPAYTSKGCSACGHVDDRNRPDQATFACTSCGFAEHADVNAARNIAARGVAGWAVSHAADDAA